VKETVLNQDLRLVISSCVMTNKYRKATCVKCSLKFESDILMQESVLGISVCCIPLQR
jgi:hypothetical protein